MEENLTGVKSLAKILQNFGIINKPQQFLQENNITDDKLSWEQLTKIIRKKHLRCELIHPSQDELRELPLPLMARMVNGKYVVVITINDECVYLIDPAAPKPLALPHKKFVEAWTGEVMTFSATYNWNYFKKKYNLPWFMHVMQHYKRFFGEVLMAAFFLQLMGIGMPLITQVIIDKVIGNSGYSTLTVIGCSMVLFFLIQSLLTGLRTYVLNHTTVKLDAILGT